MAEAYDPKKTPKYIVMTAVVVAAAVGAIVLVRGQAEGHAARGAGLLSEGRPAEAATAYRQAVRAFPFKAGHYHGLGRALEAAGDAAGAEAQYRRARWLGWKNPPTSP